MAVLRQPALHGATPVLAGQRTLVAAGGSSITRHT
ncbi:hypothetical protein SFR_0025 [Streptomyces sp. FR-008]|nr:hypothetical protein SFR_0025 [Streptomyces sp. FR-008]